MVHNSFPWLELSCSVYMEKMTVTWSLSLWLFYEPCSPPGFTVCITGINVIVIKTGVTFCVSSQSVWNNRTGIHP